MMMSVSAAVFSQRIAKAWGHRSASPAILRRWRQMGQTRAYALLIKCTFLRQYNIDGYSSRDGLSRGKITDHFMAIIDFSLRGRDDKSL